MLGQASARSWYTEGGKTDVQPCDARIQRHRPVAALLRRAVRQGSQARRKGPAGLSAQRRGVHGLEADRRRAGVQGERRHRRVQLRQPRGSRRLACRGLRRRRAKLRGSARLPRGRIRPLVPRLFARSRWQQIVRAAPSRAINVEIVSQNRAHGGKQLVVAHESSATGTGMTFSIFLPLQADGGARLPVVWYLSGLTCTHANVTDKGEYRAACAEHGLVLVAPDTSPRGQGIPDGEGYDFGQGAGFYVDATEEPWSANYRMWTYVTDELPAL